MIQSFADRATEQLWREGTAPKIDPRIHRIARRKLTMLRAAQNVNDMRVPPGNRLELLGGNRAGQYSVRINDQWRICFTWMPGGPAEVQIVDYH